MRIVSWNIMDGGGRGAAKCRLEGIVRKLRELDADIIVLQEANGFEEHHQAILEKVAGTLDRKGYLARARSGFNVACFWRRSLTVFDIKSYGNPYFHVAFSMTVAVTPIFKFQLTSVHLCPDSPNRRAWEARALVNQVTSEVPTLIIGDFNSPDPVSDGSRILQELPLRLRHRYMSRDQPGVLDNNALRVLFGSGLYDVGRRSGVLDATFPSSLDLNGFCDMRLDYAFASSSMSPAIKDFKVLRESPLEKLSDHYPILVELNSI